MAIKTFKDIVGNQGYRVDKKDREIFEREVRRGLFGIDQSDIIEFVLYDSSDNALPQEASNGKKVRYISITDNNIKKYFSKTDKTKYNLKANKADEFYVNVELLIREAGYSNGIFKSSVSLLNRRLGSEDRLYDRAWIHEISPSRTEVRVLQVIDESTGQPNTDLAERYKVFVECEDFAADVITFLDDFSAQFDIRKVIQEMLTIRGNVVQGEGYIKLIEKEFKIGNFENWLSLVKVTFDKALDNFRTNRYDNPLERDKFGQPTGESFGIGFGSSGIIQKLVSIAENCVEYHLPNQSIRTETKKTIEQQKTLDKVGQILKTVESNTEFDSDKPASKQAAIRGCRDPKAKNFNPLATVDDVCNYEYTVTKYRKVAIPPPPPPPPPPSGGGGGGPVDPPPPSGGGGSGPVDPPPAAVSYLEKVTSSNLDSNSPYQNSTIPTSVNGQDGNHYTTIGGGDAASKKNFKWTVSGPSWIIFEKRSYNGPGIFKYKVLPNDGGEREGTITVTGQDGRKATLVRRQPGKKVVAPTYPAAGTIISDSCAPGTTTRVLVTADGKGGSKTVNQTRSPICGYQKPVLDDFRENEREVVSTGGGSSSGGGGTGGGCLVGNTMIELSTGESIPIKDIKKGDYINGLNILTLSSFAEVEDSWMGSDISEYENTIHQVVDVQRIMDTDVYSINEGLLEASPEHKHIIKRDGTWFIQTTDKLIPGDIFLDRDKREVMITSIMLDRTDEVFNIELDGKHTYYANNILTHNKVSDFLNDPYGDNGGVIQTKPGKESQMF